MISIIKEFIIFLKHLFFNKKIFISLVKNDFRSQYLGSYLGLIWAFVQPVSFILILWFVFEVGFRAKPVGDVPFILWLICGLIPWFFISNAISASTNSIVSNSYLVKKVVFRVSLLPLMKISISSMIHFFFLGVLFLIFFLYGFTPTIYWLQIPLYIFLSLILLMGLSWLLSSLAVFIKDISQAIPIFMQFGFWLTPIFWSPKMVPEQYMFLIDYNPFNFIIQGYRNSLIYNKWFFEDLNLFLIHSSFFIFVFVLGAVVFKKLRPHFADVI